MDLILYLVGSLGACFLAYRLGKRSVELKLQELGKSNGISFPGEFQRPAVDLEIEPFGPRLKGFRVGLPDSHLKAIPHPRSNGQPRIVTFEVLPGVTLRQYQSKADPDKFLEVLYYDGSHQRTEIPRDTFEIRESGARVPGEVFRKDWKVYAAEEIPSNLSDGTTAYNLKHRAIQEKLPKLAEIYPMTDEQWKKTAEEWQFPLESQSVVDGVCTHLGVMRQVYNKGAYIALGPGHRVWCRECRTTFTLPVIKAAEPSTQKTA